MCRLQEYVVEAPVEQPPVEDEREVCPVCDGSGLLLKGACPLCGDATLAQGDANFQKGSGRVGSKMATLPKSNLCLVLDIDGTLLSEAESVGVESMHRLLRPHMNEFLDAAFANYSAVAIWTAGCQEWLEAFLAAADPEGKRPWAFTWSFDRISWQKLDEANDDGSPAWQHVKRLQKIWKNKTLRTKGFGPHTTLLVDNSPGVCLPNYGNSIYIKTYADETDPKATGAEGDGVDDCLLVLMDYLKYLNEVQKPGYTVRHMDKRGWYEETKSRTKARAHTI